MFTPQQPVYGIVTKEEVQTPNSSMVVVEPSGSELSATLQMIRPFPKAAARKRGGGRKKLSSTILTDTPVKNVLQKERTERDLRRRKLKTSKLAARRDISKSFPDIEPDGKSTFKNMLTSKDPHFSIDSAKIEIGDWCLFEYVFDSKTYYVGKIVEVKEDKVSADFLKFVYKDKDTEEAKFLSKDKGICEADMDQIVVKLGDPILQKSKRRNGHIKFSFDFSAYSLGL